MGELHTFTTVPVPARFAADQMQCFADLLNGRGDGLTAVIDDGLANQKVVDAVLRSLEQEKWVTIQ
jgi:hypothetical protein